MKIEVYIQDLIGVGLFIFFETIILISFIIQSQHFKK